MQLQKQIDMIKKIPGEVWKQLQFSGYKNLRKKYAVSTTGRAASYTEDVNADGKLLNGSLTSGYKTLNLHVQDGNGTIYLHREIAKLFCKKASPKQKYVIHLNHKKTDNGYKNLKWATMEEVSSHQQNSPEKIAYKERQANRTVGLKLTATQVKAIKEAIKNPKRKLTYKQMAAKYGVSEMTLYRIKSGENWGRI
jgi:NUMOD4 motif